MSNDDKKSLVEHSDTNSGFTNAELEKIENYREKGLPGIIEVTDHKFMEAFNMRLDGRSWRDISFSLGIPKIALMHLGEKYNWHERRLEYLDGYELHLREQLLEEKIHSQYFMMKATYAMRRRMGKKFDKYISTGEESVMNEFDLKELQVYMKMAETIAGLDAKGIARDSSNAPAVGLNLGDGAVVKKLADGSVEITPKQKSHADMLAELAKHKREQKNKDQK